MKNERENYSWGVIQDIIEREISSAFKLREPLPPCSKKETPSEIYQSDTDYRALKRK